MIVCLFHYTAGYYTPTMLRAKHMSVKSIRIGTHHQIQPEDENYFYLLPDTRRRICNGKDKRFVSQKITILLVCMGAWVHGCVDVTHTRIVNSIKCPNRFTISDYVYGYDYGNGYGYDFWSALTGDHFMAILNYFLDKMREREHEKVGVCVECRRHFISMEM